MSQEKIHLLRAYGARVVITPTAVPPEDPRSYYNVAKRIVSETPNAILANQYHNPENPRSHYQTTGPEIWEQTQGKVTGVMIGMGTGGTITGVGRSPKEQNPAHTSLEEVLPDIVSGNVIIVTEGDRPVGILTKIDVLDFISQEI